VSRPQKALAEMRTVSRAVAALGTQVERLTVAVEQLRAGQPSKMGRAEDACQVLGISRASLWRGVKAGTIPCERVGKRAIRFDLAALTKPNEARQ
jgi:predicted DNA-binding transcriptional regulator AlpA